MRIHGIFIVCLLFFIFSCGEEPKAVHDVPPTTPAPIKKQEIIAPNKKYPPPAEQPAIIEQNDVLEIFFSKCELDLNNAANVVETKDIVFSLSHLQTMDNGGDKFYLLERENISEMINAVIQKIYSDYILINQNGTVIYTKKNNTIFSKNVRHHMQPKALRNCFANASDSIFVSDILESNGLSNKDILLFSKKVKGRDNFSGTLILQLDAGQVQKVIGDTKFIIGSDDGKYRVVKEKTGTHRPYEFFSLIDKNFLSANKNTLLIPEKGISGRAFNYSNLSWIVLENVTVLN